MVHSIIKKCKIFIIVKLKPISIKAHLKTSPSINQTTCQKITICCRTYNLESKVRNKFPKFNTFKIDPSQAPIHNSQIPFYMLSQNISLILLQNHNYDKADSSALFALTSLIQDYALEIG